MNKIKTILAVILILCTFLPLSRCERKPIMESAPHRQMKIEKDKEAPDLHQSNTKDRYSYLVPIKEVRLDEPKTFVWILAFIWPLPFWFVRSRLRFKWKTILFSLIEICLIAFSFYLIIVWSVYFGETLYGGYIALVCISGITIIFLYEVIVDIMKWRKREYDTDSPC